MLLAVSTSNIIIGLALIIALFGWVWLEDWENNKRHIEERKRADRLRNKESSEDYQSDTN